jgi:hypothetical protein
VSYRYQTPKYFLSQTYQLCLTDITHLLLSCHRHSSCVLQTLHAYICLVIDTSIVSYRHYTPAYALSETHQLCLTNMTHLHMSCHRHIYCILQTSHVYICLVTDTSIVSYIYYTPTYVLSQTHQLCFTDITRIHVSCHRHTICVLQTLHAYICLVTDTAIVSYIHHIPTYVLFHRHINYVLKRSHIYIHLVTDTSIVSYRHYMPTYVFKQTHQLCPTYITRLHILCHRHTNCVLQTLHAYLCLVIDISIVSYRPYMPTYVLSQTLQLCLTDITRLHISYHRYINCV